MIQRRLDIAFLCLLFLPIVTREVNVNQATRHQGEGYRGRSFCIYMSVWLWVYNYVRYCWCYTWRSGWFMSMGIAFIFSWTFFVPVLFLRFHCPKKNRGLLSQVTMFIIASRQFDCRTASQLKAVTLSPFSRGQLILNRNPGWYFLLITRGKLVKPIIVSNYHTGQKQMI